MTQVVDALGTRCPVPVRLLARAAARASPGELIEVLADDPLVRVDLPAYCHDAGHVIVTVEEEGRETRAIVRVGPRPGSVAGRR
jgi:tRNA 2-thiouridine synthesizing protein A